MFVPSVKGAPFSLLDLILSPIPDNKLIDIIIITIINAGNLEIWMNV